jgi:hypothetical protein
MNKLTLIQLLNITNIPFLSYTDKVVFVVENELHECFLDENGCVAAEETWSDGCTLDDYVKEAGRNKYIPPYEDEEVDE